jgi:periplasmic divalent cation tolerance protein
VKSPIMVIVTTNSKQEAQKIITNLLRNRLIACGNIIGPISSSFWWKNNVEQSEEFILLLKSQMRLYEEIENEVLELHSYETPEILVLPIVEGSKPYLDWISNSVKSIK